MLTLSLRKWKLIYSLIILYGSHLLRAELQLLYSGFVARGAMKFSLRRNIFLEEYTLLGRII